MPRPPAAPARSSATTSSISAAPLAAIPIAGWIPTSVRRILEGGDEALDIVRRVVDKAAGKDGVAAQLREAGALAPAASTRLLAPIPDPPISGPAA